MVWPCGQGMVYDNALWAQHDIWYGLAGITWYMLWPGRHRMVYGMVWPGEACHGMWKGIVLHALRHCHGL